ncbi:GNAT family N-acetyltransferase [Micromonospora cathayae]|uniref:Lysine N-acyltransferase MbtK n=1 Tax=Micromonospora cathayae TaxID=3028804 RepID=A0ABY7ZX93_9ACTN|nr:GNAT family N-acetyltransferase [Micromonospora sp. HUAS 3]WDZ86519.1 GNAT family N-acetyltransferase [Micromonospora sp. HUAS 3]
MTPTSEPVWRRHVDGFGEVTVRPVAPDTDADLIHDWVTRERARYWGMRDADRERVRDVYAYVDSLPSHHAYLIHRDGRPVGLFQTYEPTADPVGECYDVQPGDFGIHLMVAPPDGGPEPGFTGAVLGAFLEFVLADPAHRRIVAEPDARNDRAIARLARAGFVPGPQIDLPEKRAQLMFLVPGEDQSAVRPSRQ